MDRTSIFKQLGVGVKFDFKRFGKDARRLNGTDSASIPASTVARDRDDNVGNDSASALNGNAKPTRGLDSKAKKKRKRKSSSSSSFPDDSEGIETPPKRERTTSAASSSSETPDIDAVVPSGAIRLMTGVDAGQIASGPSRDEKRKRKKKKKKRKSQDDGAANASKKEEETNAFRNSLKIHVKGTDIPDPVRTFQEMRDRLGLNPVLVENLKKFEYENPTPIQMQAVPVLTRGRNVLASAPTGSGKTLAFSLPVLHRLGGPKSGLGFRAVLLSPTRELALQTYRVFHRLAEGLKMKVFMVDSRREKAAEKFAPKKSKGSRFDVLITTPSRLVGLLQRKPSPGVCLKNVECLVVDESDKLFETNFKDGGFRRQLAAIYKACVNPKIQLAMFSATYQSNVEEWCRRYLDNVVEVTIGAKNATVQAIDQRVQFVGSIRGKIIALREIIKKGVNPPVLVFTESQESAEKLYSELIYDTVNVDVIHAGKTQIQREESIKKFRIGSTWILICTELLGRGMDFQGVNLVVNYDFPRSAISYVHRIGRTGRAGRKGEAVTFFTEDDTEYLRSIAGVMRNSGCVIPDHLLVLTEKRKEIGRMNKQRIMRLKEDRKNKRKLS